MRSSISFKLHSLLSRYPNTRKEFKYNTYLVRKRGVWSTKIIRQNLHFCIARQRQLCPAIFRRGWTYAWSFHLFPTAGTNRANRGSNQKVNENRRLCFIDNAHKLQMELSTKNFDKLKWVSCSNTQPNFHIFRL